MRQHTNKALGRFLGTAFALTALWLALASPASAAEFPYALEPKLSLTGDCSTNPGIDEIPDPGCPYSPPPNGPSARFEGPTTGVAIDAYGNEYVASYAGDGLKGRIDVFDDEGNFITELADPHGPKSVAVDSKGNLYVFEAVLEPGRPSEVVRYSPTIYKPEEGEIAYGAGSRVVLDTDESTLLGGVAIDPSNDHLYAGWWGNYITEYSSADEGNNLLETIEPTGLLSNATLAVDGQRRRLYASSCRNGISDCVVKVLEADAPHAQLEELDGSTTPMGDFLSASGRIPLAVDEETGHFVVGDLAGFNTLYEFGQDYEYLSQVVVPETVDNTNRQAAISNSQLNPDAKNRRHLFVSISKASGSVFAFEPPTAGPPVIESPSAENIGETEAELRAGIDPEGADAEYTIEYVSEAQFEASEFSAAELVGEGTLSGSKLREVSAFIVGLTAGTEYRFRVVAENELGKAEAEATFSTFLDAPATPTSQCSNASLRGGSSAALPDCRAYELATPADTNGNPTKGTDVSTDNFGTVQSSPLGVAVSFQLLGGALPGTEGTGGFYGDRYLATRGGSGWSTELAGPTGTQTSQSRPGGISPDQGHGFWLAGGEGSAVLNGQETSYVRYPDGHSELIGRGSLGTDPSSAGRLITENGSHIVFQTDFAGGVPQQLEPNAPPTGTGAVYDRTADEVTHVVSLLPGDVTPNAGQGAAYRGASADGEGIAFEIANTLYLRVGNEVTYEIGTGVEFAGVSDGGKRIFYLEGGDLFAYDTAVEEAIAFTNTADAGVVNVAPEGTRAYFVSEEAIGGSGENPNGASPVPGEQNLYLSEEGQVSFVAAVTERDVEGVGTGTGTQFDGLGLWSREAMANSHPGYDPSRLTPDGSVLLFQSRANLDDYEPGKFPQIYRYDSSAERLDCISCPPTKTPASGGAALQSFSLLDSAAPFGPSGYVQALRSDGKRAFFESTEALVSTDTDGLRDVYEWEEEGVGSCKRSGGCIYLISPGNSATGEYLFGHSNSGNDVFFTSNDTLVSEDQDTLSVYDARVGGGFAANESAGECLGGACQPSASAPDDPSPASVTFRGSGNVKAASKTRCPKGRRLAKRKGKQRCVKRNSRAQRHNRKAAKGKGGGK